ncbi:MAG: VWA domain-containing protein [Candidatus Omnitrophica bacterium]|nr:VWA domain-containing protein [Candidatus Omnitrophota bacterium]
MTHFAAPQFLMLILLLPLVVYLSIKYERRFQSSIRFSNRALAENIRPNLRAILSNKIVYLRTFILLLVIFALARPESITEETKVYTEGIDIVLTVDVSGSMRAMDFEIKGERVDRLQAVKDVLEKFIPKRPNDRIGLVAFAALAYTVCPLTLDHDWLEKNLQRISIGMMEDGTAIGSAISASLNRLKDAETKEKIIILLTDGRNNAGRISPLVAAEAAKALGVKIYTIGAGTKGLAPYPVQDMFGNVALRSVKIDIDEDLLKKIADETGGMYFRATDISSLEDIYDEIDKLETTPMEETGYNVYKQLFPFLLIPALMLFLLEVILSNTWLRRIP